LLEEAAAKLGESATPADEMAKALASDTAAEYQGLLEQDWLKFVLQQ
jgi:hypothetical protein